MKDILLIHTGGTIGSFTDTEIGARVQNSKTVQMAGEYLVSQFKKSSSTYRKVNIVDARFPSVRTTLSESMTLDKLSEIIAFIRTLKTEDYAGVVVLHGTDTLAYTAAIFSFVFAKTPVPIFLVSGNRPPKDPLSNATVNFISAVELICEGIAPNVYVTYRNSDQKIRLYLGSNIMQSGNFSEDFFGASDDKVFEITWDSLPEILRSCKAFAGGIRECDYARVDDIGVLSNEVLLINPFTGLNYSLYSHCFDEGSQNRFRGVVHGTYHSGTVSWPGLVLYSEARKCRAANDTEKAEIYEEMTENESNSANSIRYLARLCRENSVPLFIAPSKLGVDQYETMNIVAEKTGAILLNMSTESAYAKLVVALSLKMTPAQIAEYMQLNINNEKL